MYFTVPEVIQYIKEIYFGLRFVNSDTSNKKNEKILSDPFILPLQRHSLCGIIKSSVFVSCSSVEDQNSIEDPVPPTCCDRCVVLSTWISQLRGLIIFIRNDLTLTNRHLCRSKIPAEREKAVLTEHSPGHKGVSYFSARL